MKKLVCLIAVALSCAASFAGVLHIKTFKGDVYLTCEFMGVIGDSKYMFKLSDNKWIMLSDKDTWLYKEAI